MSSAEKWYNSEGPQGDVAISTRVRLARNLRDEPFPGRLPEEKRTAVLTRVREALMENPAAAQLFDYTDMEKLSRVEAGVLAEKHLVSPEFAAAQKGGLLLSRDESLSVMLLEEDHLRIQSLAGGFEPDAAYEAADRLDCLFEEKLEYAFDEKLGYLTSCPTNLGTGLRVSVMLHLPALTAGGVIGQLIGAVAKLGLTVRGLYGEGSQALGSIYQVSNQVTLGVSEYEIIEKLKSIVGQIIGQERIARENLRKADEITISDKVWRSFGVLTHARSLSSGEFMSLASDVRLGAAMGLIPGVQLRNLNALIVAAQPAGVTARHSDATDPRKRDVARATLIRGMMHVS